MKYRSAKRLSLIFNNFITPNLYYLVNIQNKITSQLFLVRSIKKSVTYGTLLGRAYEIKIKKKGIFKNI